MEIYYPSFNLIHDNFFQIAGRLPIDLTLGRLVSYGVQLGLSTEAVIIAAALSLPKSPFRVASTSIHTDPDEYNKCVHVS